jgi:O-antigen/teichoic acid export membrane protein
MSLRSRLSQNSLLSFLSLVGVRLLKFGSTIVFVNIAGSTAVGIYYVFLSLFRLLNRVGLLGLGQSIIKHISEFTDNELQDTTAPIIFTALALRFVSVGFLILGVTFLRARVDSYVGFDGAWLALSVLLVFIALYATFRSILFGQRRVGIASMFDVVRDGSVALVQVVLVVVGYAEWGLVAGLLFGLLLATISIVVYVRPPIRFDFDRTQAESLVSFAKFSYLDDLVGGEYRWLDVLILGIFVPADQIGVYGVAYAVSQFGFVFSIAIARNILPEVSNLTANDQPEQRDTVVRKSLQYSTLLAIPILVGTVIIGDRLLSDVYSLSSGSETLVILCCGAVVYSAYQQIHQLFYGLDNPKYAFGLSLLSGVINVGLALVLVPQFGIIGTAISTTLALIVVFVVGLLLADRLTSVSVALPLRHWILQIGSAIVMGVVVATVNATFAVDHRLFSAVLVLIGGLTYGPLLLIADSFLRNQLKRSVTNVLAS